MSNYIIGEVLDVSTRTRSSKFGYRIGRKCKIKNDEWNQWKIGNSLVVEYPDDKYFTTSPMEDFEETDYGVWVTTKNRIYRFDRIWEE